MPKTKQEKGAIRYAKSHWRVYAGCGCDPEVIDEGEGYDLKCGHRHVEVKGTRSATKAFVTLTGVGFDAARTDRRFEIWLITRAHTANPAVYVVPRNKVVERSRLRIQWEVPLGKERLIEYRKVARQRESKRPRTRRRPRAGE
jgi:hypothetical protein